jgi:hypothetical protein
MRRKSFDIVAKNLGSLVTDAWEKVRSIISRCFLMRRMTVMMRSHIQDNGQSNGEPPHLEITEKEPLQEGVKRVTISTLSGVPYILIFRIRGIL